MYLVTYEVRRHTEGSFEVESLDEIFQKLADTIDYVSKELGYGFGAFDDMRREVGITGIYKSEPFTDYNEDEFFEKAWQLQLARFDKENAQREKWKTKREQEELQRLKEKYPDAQ